MLLREAGVCCNVVGSPIAVYHLPDARGWTGPACISGTDLWLWLMPLFLFGETILYSLMADGKSGTEKLLHLRLQFYGATRQGSVAVPISPSDMWAIAMLVVRSRVPVSACE
jgi:hypothetical protein